MAVSPARWAAFQILRRVERDGAYASELLHSQLTSTLADRDLALTEELVLGVLRRQGELDATVAEASGRPASSLDLEARLALRLGIYQLHHLDRIPQRAAVWESVEIVKQARKTSLSGLVNALLRKAAGSGRGENPTAEWYVPGWLLDRWRQHFGRARADALALCTAERPPTYLRLNARFDANETIGLLESEGVTTEATELPLCRRVLSGNPSRTESFHLGRIRIQDLGSQRVGALLDLRPGQGFLDACAAPGGKTFQALEQAGGTCRCVAGDLHPQRLTAMRRLATLPVPLVALDAGRSLPFSGTFDRILADVPCSGTGTLARNPEIKWRLTEANLGELAVLQRSILRGAVEHLAPEGRLVYSTCSLEPEENEQVIESVLQPPWQVLEQHFWLPCEHPGDGFFACVIGGKPRDRMEGDSRT